MKYFSYLDKQKKDRVFYKLPEEINKDTDINLLKYSIGALLYIPAINKDKLYKFFSGNIEGAVSVAICLEDSVGNMGENEAINNIREIFRYIKRMEIQKKNLPLIFIRPKNIQQMMKLIGILKSNLDILTGIIIPKADAERITKFIHVLDEYECSSLYIMPIIETTEFTQIDTKNSAFRSLKKVINDNYNRILNIRIGVTDILGAYSLRRDKKYTIYDNIIFNSFLSDLISLIAINDNGNMVISGGVSEFYNMDDTHILENYIREIELDKMNGFIGKTVIHPKQLKVWQAMSVVSFEDYIDAENILENVNGKYGVSAGIYKNRMNEVNPHLNWAKKVMSLSKIYGVFNEGCDYNELT